MHVDDSSVKSCTLLAVAVDGARVTTVEGLGKPDALHPMQLAFHENPRFAVRFLHARHADGSVDSRGAIPDPTEADVRHWLEAILPLYRISEHRDVGPRRNRGDAC